jgi:spore coat protein U-like protein
MHNLKKSIKSLIASLVIILAHNAGAASTATTTFTVSASVISSCSISASNMAFGNYSLAQLDATSTVTVTCTSGAVVKIGLNAGTGSGATVSARKMASGSNTLSYGLYSDSSRSVNWGNTPGTDTVNTTGTGSAQAFTVYGRVPANQTSPIGTYSDTVTATVTFS